MNGSSQVKVALAAALAAEAHLNIQYRKDWRSVKFLGARKVARVLKDFGDDVHGWQKAVNDRLLFLGGEPAFDVGSITIQTSLEDTFKNELALEMAIVTPYEKAIQTCMAALDDTSRNLFEHLLKWHQKHVAWLEQQIALIDGMDQATYLSAKI